MNEMYDLKNYFWQGEHVRLRAFQPDDWRAKYQEFLDSETRRLLQWCIELPKTDEMYAESFAESCYFKDAKETNTFMFSMETVSNEFVGWINMHSRDQKNGTFSFAVGIFEPYRRMGYAMEACHILFRFAFHELRLQKCNSDCVGWNHESVALHKKLGFTEEGKQRRSIYTMGQYHDLILFGLTREEFDEWEIQHPSVCRKTEGEVE